MVKKLATGILIAASLVSWLLVLTPVELLRNDVAQTARTLEVSYTLHRWNVGLTPVLVLVGAAALVAFWRRGSSRIGRGAMSVLWLGLLASVVVAWSNTLEWRYHPMGELEFVGAGEARHLTDGDMVLGVTIDGDSRAYSVRQLIYHHVVNDVVAGVPLAVTF